MKDKKIEIKVVFDPKTGQCTVNGPVQFKTFCVIALAKAIECVAAHVPPVIQPATVVPKVVLANGGTH